MNGEVVKAPVGERVHLNCTGAGSPTPDISWWRNADEIVMGNVIIVKHLIKRSP